MGISGKIVYSSAPLYCRVGPDFPEAASLDGEAAQSAQRRSMAPWRKANSA